MASFQTSFHSLNWVLLFHGISGYIFINTWNRRRLFFFEVVVCTIFWVLTLPNLIGFLIFNCMNIRENIFRYTFNIIDDFSWMATTAIIHLVSLFRHEKLQKVQQDLLLISSPDLRFKNKFLFQLSLASTMAYAYGVIPLIRHNYDSGNGVDLKLLAIYCYQLALTILESIYVFLIVWQVKKNFSTLQYKLSCFRTTFDKFDVNLKVYRNTVQIFQFMIVLYLFNLILGITFCLFNGIVANQLEIAFYEHFIWYVSFIIILGCCVQMDGASKQVII